MHVLQQMLAVVRCGRFVIVGMTANEGVHMGYEGFHQWNFANLRGRLTLHARNTTDVDVLTALGSAAVRSIRCNHKSAALGRDKPGALLCHIQKSTGGATCAADA